MTSDTKPTICPSCQAELTQATGINNESAPSAGDVTICWTCGEMLVYDEELLPVKPTLTQLVEIQRSHEWGLIERAMKAVRARNALGVAQ